jgi:hypothetical protein
MLTLIPYFSGDKDQAIRLSRWIADLGGVKNHDCLLVIDKSTNEAGVIEPLREAFRSVETVFSAPVGAQGSWGSGTTDATAANEMWMTGANYVYHKLKVPFFWLEPDAAPTRSTWLDEIEAEYIAAGKPFMGMLVNMPPHEKHMSGVGCYPKDVANHSTIMMMPGPVAWDYAGRRDTVEKGKAHFTDLIQHVYRINGNKPEWPTFPTLESLFQINQRAAVFHRCKDETLIERLREQRGTSVRVEPDTLEKALIREEALKAEVLKLTRLLAGSPEKLVLDQKGKRVNSKSGRTPEQQKALNERMAKARAGRKKKLTGVK